MSDSALSSVAGGDGQPDSPDAEPLRAVRDAPVGGQAVLEGVMMRGVSTWAVAVRKPDGMIDVQSFPLVSWLKRHRVYRLPFIRGVVALVESLKIGLQALGISTNAQLDEEEQQQISGGAWAGTVAFSLALAVGLFFLLPVGITSIFKSHIGNSIELVPIEKAIRISIFVGSLWLTSRIPALQRVFEYHGPEHKPISCYEAGLPLTPQNAQRFSRLLPRCGTSFLLIVMVVALFVFAPLGLPAWYVLLASRVLGVPLIAGLSFELIKFAGRNRSRGWVRGLMWPGMQLQKLTTREPDAAQLAVAIAAMDAVLAVEDPRGAAADDLVGMEVVA